MKQLKNLKIHLIGIGGIGISGIARYLKAQGAIVSGSDISPSKLTKELQNQGIPITIPHNKSSISNQDLIIHSAIIPPNNIEILEAQSKNIPILSRKDALKLILAQKKVISVCGAHGKSTTSAMLSSIFPHYGAIIGAVSKEFGSNVRESANEGIIFEADESDKSFLNSNPHYAIVTNAELEHMQSYDYSIELFHQAYRDFLGLAKTAFINSDDPFLATLKHKHIPLSPSKDITDISFFLRNDEPFCKFILRDLGEFEVWGLGGHTAANAAMAILCAAQELDIPTIRENLKNFAGIKKRFDIIQKQGPCIIDDYAHHPTEIIATLNAAKDYTMLKGHHQITAIWQPHKFSRLKDNLEAFQGAFDNCTQLIILPTYRAGEEEMFFDMPKLFARYNPIMASHIKRDGMKILVYQGQKLLKILEKELVIGMGAGDITYQIRGEK
ncbi:UDP-N-acetylmuramate--L-alanine ligase [Helicobacter mustelae]|uniref:UDP-N-acetylmuramate--L-alanine ligase n=1 Tax=Helicobacter mustelae (strain ATCC 43772 / CCUG 25715 / CIP 103759 / LMG 18044 / NCTC 12198 / R85-136P) TaxID=679897 RepID=D3UIQ3_HELM1|nr:UDP-N-acetylmuramate--alanine ligase [Helicobacter mustelae 12198]SQH71877.1 UDP-N-acetylmuramate--alanine ligase [Helicobacter mustelae]STP13017.1 UDP-N-acetylmuramate--alanine ligase [Helicobacter mustelae]